MLRKVACGLVLMLALATACTSAADDEGRGAGTPATEYPASQAWALDDGHVTEEEYRAAVSKFALCAEVAGYQVTDPVLSPIDGLTLLFDIKREGDPRRWNAVMEDCNEATISQIEPAFVEQRRQVMDPSLRDAVSECIARKGFILTGTEKNVKDFTTSADMQTNVVMECVSGEIRKLLPETPAYLKVRW